MKKETYLNNKCKKCEKYKKYYVKNILKIITLK